MKSYHLTAPGPDGLVVRDAPTPQPGPGEALVRFRALSLNARDLMMMDGKLGRAFRADAVPLSDGAGEVAAIGRDVTRVEVGDRVVASFRQGWLGGKLEPWMLATDLGGPIDGTLREYAVLAAEGLVRLPDGVSFETAASLPCAGVTAWCSLTGGQAVRPGDSVLIQGTGGVALFALQLSIGMGARVIATTSNQAKAAKLLELGASVVIDRVDYPDWAVEVVKATGGRGVDRVIEVGGPGSLATSMAAIAMGGEVTLIGLQDSPAALVSPVPLISRHASIRGLMVGSRSDLEALVNAVSVMGLEPQIDRRFGFSEAGEAYRRLRSGEHIGKVVIILP